MLCFKCAIWIQIVPASPNYSHTHTRASVRWIRCMHMCACCISGVMQCCMWLLKFIFNMNFKNPAALEAQFQHSSMKHYCFWPLWTPTECCVVLMLPDGTKATTNKAIAKVVELRQPCHTHRNEVTLEKGSKPPTFCIFHLSIALLKTCVHGNMWLHFIFTTCLKTTGWHYLMCRTFI